MSLRSKQSVFVFNVSKLIQFAYSKGFELTFGEAWRSEVTQQAYVATGRSKTLDSRHLIRLAVDFNIFYEGRMLFAPGVTKEQYVADLELMRPIFEFWESLNTDNVCGADWNRNHIFDEKFLDPYHFEQKP